MKNALLASTSSRFASLFGPVRAEEKKPDDKPSDDRARRAGESDEDYAKRMEESDQKDREAAREKKDGETDEDYATRMKELDDKEKAETDEDDKEKEAAAVARGIAMERARWGEVLASKEAVGRGALACSLLADTDLAAAQICKTLAVTTAETAASARTPLATRMAAAAIVAPTTAGPEAPKAGTTAATVALVLAAAAKARGETPKAA